ncbi:MAG: DNA polymerase III subunit alpha [Bacteroidota bacterium]
MIDFVHLHNHSHYSILDALCTPAQLLESAIADGQKAIALTDHGVMFGSVEFFRKADEINKEAKKQLIKPLIGFEAYVANGSRFDTSAGKAKTKRRNYFHLVLLAKNQTGYKNLMKLTSLAHLEGYYYKPRIDRELLEKYNEGIIALSACIAGEVNANLINGEYETAFNSAKYHKDVFGEDFYLELQNHHIEDDDIILRDAPKIAKELCIKLVATNDIHYLKSDHAYAHNVHLFIRDSGSSANGDRPDVYRLRYRTPEMYFKTRQQMNELFKDFPEALANTLEVADKCDVSLESKIFMPDFPIPVDAKAKDLNEYLDEVTMKGLELRYPQITDEILERVKYELDVIKKMNFSGYFLIVHDFVKAAKELGVSVGPGRGSAVGSVVVYALGITNIDPLPYDLLFERFLNPERVSLPDIDIDFSDDKRDKVINYVKEKYGNDSVAQIITFGRMSSRAVLTDVGRVLGIDLSLIKKTTSKVPVEQGKVKPLKEAIELLEIQNLVNVEDPKLKEWIDFSLLLENLNRNAGTHAAGVVIAPGDISDYVPIYQPSKSKNQSIEIATQYSMNDLEYAGLLKMDFLGLRTLSIIDNTLAMIKDNYGIDIDIDKIDFDDEKTYALLSCGNTLGVFQFESQGMQEYLRQLKPNNLEELTAMNALYRPGPMDNIPEFIERKHGKKPITYLHPIMEKSLKKTYGIIVYQEQVMQLTRDLAGFSVGKADLLRRAMGKKKAKEMEKEKIPFIEGAAKNVITAKLADEIFELIQKFAKYGFNKSHSLAYSYLAFQTAWLKAHYPTEFLAANMSAELNNLDKIVLLIEEAKNFGIKILPPDVNRSMAEFTAHDNSIFFGLAGLKGIGVSAVESIVKARNESPFVSFYDFVARCDAKAINRRVLESLIASGAFDSLKSGHRASLMMSVDSALEFSKAYQENQKNQDDLFGNGKKSALYEPKLKEAPPWSEKFQLEKEKEVLNFYISGNPMDRYKAHIESLGTVYLGKEESGLTGKEVRVCAMITEIRNTYDKNRNPIAFVTIEDYTGKGDCNFWDTACKKFKDLLQPDAILMFIGKLEPSEANMKINVKEVITLETAFKRYCKGYSITIDSERIPAGKIEEMSKKLRDRKSSSKVIFNLILKENRQVKKTQYVSTSIDIPVSQATTDALINIFGKNNIRFLSDNRNM